LTRGFPIDQGIAGYVARTGETLNIPDVYAHSLFNRETDLRTGYRTGTLLCAPIHDRSRNIIAVAQILNKHGEECFTAEDQTRFESFLSSISVILETCLSLKGAGMGRR
jgi:adenylate cyclase